MEDSRINEELIHNSPASDTSSDVASSIDTETGGVASPPWMANPSTPTSGARRSTTIIDLPMQVLEQILGYVFPVNQEVIPWFTCGMSLLYLTGFHEDAEGTSTKPNIDTFFLHASKACHQIGTTLLYGTNTIVFKRRSDVAKWWMQKVGDANLRKIKRVKFLLSTGWHHDRRAYNNMPNPSECSHEEHWLKALAWFRTRRGQLTYMNVTTVDWTPLHLEDSYSREDRYELSLHRKLIFDLLCHYRGIKRVEIGQIGGRYIADQALSPGLLMQQPPRDGRVVEPVRRTVQERIDYCRRQHEHKMAIFQAIVEERRRATEEAD